MKIPWRSTSWQCKLWQLHSYNFYVLSRNFTVSELTKLAIFLRGRVWMVRKDREEQEEWAKEAKEKEIASCFHSHSETCDSLTRKMENL